MILESIGEGFIVRWSTEYVEDRLCRLLHGPVDLSHLMQVYRVIAQLYVRIALLVPFPEQVPNTSLNISRFSQVSKKLNDAIGLSNLHQLRHL